MSVNLSTASQVAGRDLFRTNLQIGDIITFGKRRWIVLEADYSEGTAIILSNNFVFRSEYNETNRETTWENCHLREQLNGEFFDGEFSDEEQSLILPALISCPGENDTIDKIWLLSSEEADLYFLRPNDRILGVRNLFSEFLDCKEQQDMEITEYYNFLEEVTKHDLFNHKEVFEMMRHGWFLGLWHGWSWLLRSKNKIRYSIGYSGYIENGHDGDASYPAGVCVRPAMRIRIAPVDPKKHSYKNKEKKS